MSLDGMYDIDDEKKGVGGGNAQLNSCSKEKWGKEVASIDTKVSEIKERPPKNE